MTREEQILICAVRYALGRRSYIVGTVAEYVNSKKNELSKNCINIIIRDIKEQLEFCHKMNMTCGDEIDERTWNNLLKALEEVRNYD